MHQLWSRKICSSKVTEVARFRHLSLRTEEAYRNWIKRFILFHHKRHPRELDADAVRAFLTHLAVSEHVAASTQNQAFNALLFLYRQVLQMGLPNIEGVERASQSRKLPVVFTKPEANAVIAQMKGEPQLIGRPALRIRPPNHGGRKIADQGYRLFSRGDQNTRR